MKSTKISLLSVMLLFGMCIMCSGAYATAGNSTQKLLCLDKGETLNFSLCNAAIMDRTCTAGMGCSFCVQQIGPGIYCPANVNVCNNLNLACTSLHTSSSSVIQNGSDPQDAVVLMIRSPKENAAYASPLVFIEINSSKIMNSIQYTIDSPPGGQWKTLCTHCKYYTGSQKMKEGRNNVTFAFTNATNGKEYLTRSFLVDSKKPAIQRIDPTKGFATGDFYIQFQEQNPLSLKLYYGNTAQGYKIKVANISSCSVQKTKTTCTINAPITEFDNSQIKYWFVVTDMANTSTTSKQSTLLVDISPPQIKNITYTLKQKTASMNVTINETNFEGATVTNTNEPHPREKPLCTKLIGNSCIGKVTLLSGQNNLIIRVHDAAGNTVAQNKLIQL